RGIHAADTPATGPTPPSTDSCDLPERLSALVGVDLGRHGGALGQIRFPQENGSDPGNKKTPVDPHRPGIWIATLPRLGEAVPP
ncbi:hypothetical protein NDN64_19515, partial [Stenotrophomonas maltophilia]|nr:hypothetical protein [Stenotrophomonas maltophilia]